MADKESVPNDPDVDKEVLDDEPRNILLGIIAQLSKGMDLHRVTLPTFVLEPRSMLERLTDYMSHPDILLCLNSLKTPEERFIQIVKYYLSGWHIRPKGVKKPYNPVLGEFFRCHWTFDKGDIPGADSSSESVYIAEQVCHHPPISAFFYANPVRRIYMNGEFRPKSKFLGNSAATITEGDTRIRCLDYPDEEYVITMPNIYARGILFGTMYMEVGDMATVKCAGSDLTCELEFTTKGFFSGVFNGIKGKIKKESTGELLYTLSGKWTDIIYIQKNSRGSKTDVLFDSNASKIYSKVVAPESAQDEYESRRLWSKVTSGILSRNLNAATTEKTAIEDNQRKLRFGREQNKEEYKPKNFVFKDERWSYIHEKDVTAGSAEESLKALKTLILNQ